MNFFVADDVMHETVLYPNLFHEPQSGHFQHRRFARQDAFGSTSNVNSGDLDVDEDDGYDNDDDDDRRSNGVGVDQQQQVFHLELRARTLSRTLSSSSWSSHQVLAVRKWIMVSLVMCLLLTVSLLLGVTLQHFQLLKRLPATSSSHDSTMSSQNFNNATVGSRPGLGRLQQRQFLLVPVFPSSVDET